MSDADWNSYSEQSEKRGMPLWGKILMGCGVAAFLLFGSCVGLFYWATHSGSDTVKKYLENKWNMVIEEPWDRLIAVADAIQTDEGAAELYRDNPMLKNRYPTEADFLKNAAGWRASLGNLPRASPSFVDLEKNGLRIITNYDVGNRVKSLEMSYRTPDNTWLRLRWEDEKLVELEAR
ncbi:MAG: hypothetical protein LBQ86_03705 [Holophagales bacterium]|nr:hypothetical protein [Holophagales bacterium]